MRKILGARLLFCKGEIAEYQRGSLNIRRVVIAAFCEMRWLVLVRESNEDYGKILMSKVWFRIYNN